MTLLDGALTLLGPFGRAEDRGHDLVERVVLHDAVHGAGVAVVRSVVPSLRNALGFAKYVRDEEVPTEAVVDIASA